MKKRIHLVFYPVVFFLIIGCASHVTTEGLIIQRIIPVQGSQTQIYDSSMVWLVKTLGSVEQPLEYRNRETGEVIRKASFTYDPESIWYWPKTVDFTINIQARDNKSRITIDKISNMDGLHKSEFEELKKQLESIIDDYEAYIIARSRDEW